ERVANPRSASTFSCERPALKRASRRRWPCAAVQTDARSSIEATASPGGGHWSGREGMATRLPTRGDWTDVSSRTRAGRSDTCVQAPASERARHDRSDGRSIAQERRDEARARSARSRRGDRAWPTAPAEPTADLSAWGPDVDAVLPWVATARDDRGRT